MASSDPKLTPSIPPPAGRRPNFTDPECYRNAIYISFSICTGVATVLFFARTFTKCYIMKSVDIEDCKSCEDTISQAWLTSMLICLPLVGY